MPKAVPLVLALTCFFALPCSPFTIAPSFKVLAPQSQSQFDFFSIQATAASAAAAAAASPSASPSSSSSIGWRHPLRFNLQLKCRKRPTPLCMRASVEPPAFFYRKESGERTEKPPVLGNVSVVLMGTKLPVSVGMVARACASFEVGRLILVNPRQGDVVSTRRSAVRASKGALQLVNTGRGLSLSLCETIEEALCNATSAVAFTRWDGPEAQRLSICHPPLNACYDQSAIGDKAWLSSLSELVQGTRGGGDLPRQLQADLMSIAPSSANADGAIDESQGQDQHQLALVFGREDAGFFPGELASRKVQGVCELAMSSRWGTESLSLSQAVPIVLSRMFELAD